MDSGSSYEIAKVILKGLSSCKDEQLGPLEMPKAGLQPHAKSPGQAGTDSPSELAFKQIKFPLFAFPLIFFPTERSTGAGHPNPSVVCVLPP